MAINIVQALNAALFHLQACEKASNCRLVSVRLFGFSRVAGAAFLRQAFPHH